MPLKIDNQSYFYQNKTPNWEKQPIVVAWKFSSAENLGALLRVCDNFGVQQVFFVGDSENYKLSKIKRNATTSFKKTDWTFISEDEIWKALPIKMTKIAIDTTMESTSLNQFDFTKLTSSFCLFFGNETIGLGDNVIIKCDRSVHIPMIGNSFSMNVVNAASTVLYESIRQCLLR
jgi:tRNA (guanosine-2'-O-)-methyltransferase